MPMIPTTVRHLNLEQASLTHITFDTLATSLSRARHVTQLSLFTELYIARMTTRLIGHQIRTLKICVWGQQQNKIPADRWNILFDHMPHLTALQTFTLSYEQLEDIHFPPGLQRLSVEVIPFRCLERIVELLATAMTWCPQLLSLVHFKSIQHAVVLGRTIRGRARLNAFQGLCMRAHLARQANTRTWQGREVDVQRLVDASFPFLRRNEITLPASSIQSTVEAPVTVPDQSLRTTRTTRRHLTRRRGNTLSHLRAAGSPRDVLRRWRLGHGRHRSQS